MTAHRPTSTNKWLELLLPEVIFQAVRSRGPGGQNVNKVSSAAILYWDLRHSNLFSDEQKLKLAGKLSSFMNSEGQVMFRADEYRDLPRNKSRCLEKLAEQIAQSLHVPKKRVATKPTRSSKTKKLENKRRRGEIKKNRGRVDY